LGHLQIECEVCKVIEYPLLAYRILATDIDFDNLSIYKKFFKKINVKFPEQRVELESDLEKIRKDPDVMLLKNFRSTNIDCDEDKAKKLLELHHKFLDSNYLNYHRIFYFFRFYNAETKDSIYWPEESLFKSKTKKSKTC
jgi:hypothetical protein